MTVVNIVDHAAHTADSRPTVGMRISVIPVPEVDTGGERRFSTPPSNRH